MTASRLARVLFAAAIGAGGVQVAAQQAKPATATTPRSAARIDLTGYWVSYVTEDWRFRMITPPKGDYRAVPLTAEGRKTADAWDPAADARRQRVQGVRRRRDHARTRPVSHHLAG